MDSSQPAALQELVEALRRLPGVGPRTAERLALAMLDWSDEQLAGLATAVRTLKERVHYCATCGNFAEQDECRICRSATRSRNVICVVEQPVQISAIERTGAFDGLYHVLGGRLSPLDDRGPDDLRIRELLERARSDESDEIILATSSDVEGEATAAYLLGELRECNVRVTRIAAGIPVGADLSYADAATMAMALTSRRPAH